MSEEKQILAIPPRQALADVVPLKTPFTIMIDPCGACNLTCQFCPCNTVEDNKAERHKMMDFDLFLKVVQDIEDMEEKAKMICLFGYGEPLLHPKLPEMIRIVKEKKLCRELRVTTNGIPLTHSLSERIVEAGVDRLRISLNGLSQEDYDQQCGTNVNFEEFHENLSYFYKISRNTGTVLEIKTNSICLRTQEREDRFYHLFKSISDGTLVTVINNPWSEFEAKEVAPMKNSPPPPPNPTGVRKICTSPLTYLSVHANGKVSPCCTDWNFKAVVGDVTKNSLKEIWEGAPLHQLRMDLLQRKSVNFCDTCTYRKPDSVDHAVDSIMEKLEKERR